jgi:hypothetical protein
MPELEEFSALVGDIYDASLDPTLWPGGSFQQMGAGGHRRIPDRFEKGGGEILDIIKVAPNPDFCAVLQRVTE